MKKWIIASALLTAGFCAQAGIVYSSDFTSDTYTVGSLNDQNDWTADGPAIIAGTGVTEDGYKSAINRTSTDDSAFKSGTTYTSTITFSFNDASGGIKSGPLVGATINSGSSTTDSLINGCFKSQDNGTFRLGLYSNWGKEDTSIGYKQSGTFTAESIGLAYGSDTASDSLTLSLALTAGADTDSWDATVSLYNGATEVLTWKPSAGDLSFDAATVYGGFISGQSDSNQLVSDRVVTTSEFTSTIPEPASLGLLGLGAIITLLIRKMRR